MIRSSFVVSLLAAFGSGISFLNQLVLARIFGAGAELDAYLVAISLPLTIVGLVGGILGFQVVPALRREENVGGSFEASLLGMLAGLGSCAALLAVAGICFSSWLGPLLIRNLPAASLSIVMQTSLVAWTWVPLAVIGAILTGALHVKEKFALSTLVQPLPAIGAMVGCLLGHKDYGVSSLAWGQLAGYIVMVALLYVLLRFPCRAPDWKQTQYILRKTPFALGALLVFVIYPLPDAIWGARAGTAGVSLLGYAQRLIVGFAGLAVVGATTVLFPRLAQQAAAGAHTALKDDLSRSLRIMLACMMPAAAVLGVLALPAVRLLFVRGAFGEPEAAALAHLLHWMFGGMVAMSCMNLPFKALFAQGRVRQAASLSATGAVLYFVLAGLLVKVFGLPGIGMAYALAWWVLFFLVLRAFKIGNYNDLPFVARLTVVTLLCAISAAIGRFFLPGYEGQTAWSSLGNLITCLCIAVVVFSVTSLLWPGMDEIKWIKKELSR